MYCIDYEEDESFTFLDLDVEEESVSENLELITKGGKLTLDSSHNSYYLQSTNNYAITR